MGSLFEMPEVSGPSKKSNEWYSPWVCIKAAYKVMGGIDLDPASCEQANMVVKAARYYSIADDGLTQPWSGRVWLNPPYSAENAKRGMEPGRTQGSVIKLWINRLISEYDQGRVSEAILLTKTDLKASWFHVLWRFPVCFARDHLYFDRPGLPPEKHQFGTCFVYLGRNEEGFVEAFSELGTVVKQMSPPPTKPRTLDLWNDTSLLTNEIASWNTLNSDDSEESAS